ncbi:hypothetical protein GOBAR_AA36796 [Gossypium barbadense]|uniref:NB-ARC domain-containing protein n=1 Tax=Gossypium barbadense TaxID=3634 RepID=A0A2P5VYK6_GOSBA|nr:hypothetical protein GOBAR_AA36796 [Gossypium barbadense]
MSVFGEAALSAFLELLSAKLLGSVLNFVAAVAIHITRDQSSVEPCRGEADQGQGVKNWLGDLQDLAYDVDDILDEFAYQELRLKLQKTQAQASSSKVRKLIPTCCTGGHFSPFSFMFNAKMISKIQAITDRLNSLNTRRSSLGFSEIMSQGVTSKGKKPRLQPTSLMDGAVEYIGRANEKQETLELLKSNNSDGVCVLSILGMGGMGKTTLAQLVYNDPSIKESFDHKSWVCVSDDFDAVNITKTILRSLDADSRDENDLNLLQVKLKEKLSGKRLLLVLDDIWNESYSDWNILRAPFGAGTKIIVTTRLQKVSSNVDSVKAFYLDKLSHHDCLSIFAQHALKARNFDGHLQFKEIGENIVRRCNGLPLAAKAIGSLLRTVKNHSEWEKSLEAKEAELQPDKISRVESLRIYDCERLNRLPQVLHELTFLTVMILELNLYHEDQTSSSISRRFGWIGVQIWFLLKKVGCPAPASELSKLTSLQELTIGGGGCSNVVSFPEEGTGMMLPRSLTRIFLSEFENLEFMFSEGFQDLASLQRLEISECPKLTSLPEKDVLLSLGYLRIYRCPLLQKECSSDKGREWSKISHIPLVEIDGIY